MSRCIRCQASIPHGRRVCDRCQRRRRNATRRGTRHSWHVPSASEVLPGNFVDPDTGECKCSPDPRSEGNVCPACAAWASVEEIPF